MVNNLTERELKILSYLIDEDDFINGDDLSSRLGISKKTIQREIGSMNGILKDENCAIESVPSKGYKLEKNEKSKLINLCFSGNTNNFLEPNDFLITREQSTRNTYYTYYITIIQNIVDLLVDPPT